MTLADRWQQGADAYARGELPPADPDAADGWYWAKNAAARGASALCAVTAAATACAVAGAALTLVTFALGAIAP